MILEGFQPKNHKYLYLNLACQNICIVSLCNVLQIFKIFDLLFPPLKNEVFYYEKLNWDFFGGQNYFLKYIKILLKRMWRMWISIFQIIMPLRSHEFFFFAKKLNNQLQYCNNPATQKMHIIQIFSPYDLSHLLYCCTQL